MPRHPVQISQFGAMLCQGPSGLHKSAVDRARPDLYQMFNEP